MKLLLKIRNSYLWRSRRKWEKDFLKKSDYKPSDKQRILIIRTDEIGDYVLFRNTLSVYRSFFKNADITLAGNLIWKDIAEKYDRNEIDNFVWIDKKKYFSSEDITYRYDLIRELRSKAYSTVILPVFSPEKCGLDLFLRCGANTGYTIRNEQANLWHELIHESKDRETHFINVNETFEFYKNVEFVNKISASKSDVKFELRETAKKADRIIIAPGASRKEKQWATANFAELIDQLAVHAPETEFILTGSASEIPISAAIKSGISSDIKLKDETGKLGLTTFISLIGGSKLVITNDSSPVHIAAAMNIPVVTTHRGDHYGRFLPYPKTLSKSVHVIYPPEFQKNNVSSDEHAIYEINTIQPQEVLNVILKNDLLK